MCVRDHDRGVVCDHDFDHDFGHDFGYDFGHDFDHEHDHGFCVEYEF
jgi:hypothetical protein